MLSDFYRPSVPASGLMFLKEADRNAVWDHWAADPRGHMRRAVTRACWGDQGIIREVYGDKVARWDAVAPGAVVSYKADLKKMLAPEGASVVCFHGKPRPWDVSHPWIPKL